MQIPIDTSYSFRGLSVVDDSIAWVSGNGFGKSADGGKSWVFQKIKGFEKADFRCLYAFDAQTAIIANAGSPAHILRTTDGGQKWQTVYTNTDSLAFFDGMDFWNENEGIIYGDPMNGRMLLLRTSDAGRTWKELPVQSCPPMAAGEASFAASGTGIRCYGKQKVVIATGGKVSRLLMSEDGGYNWASISAPILQGKNSTGIFSFAFTNDTTGIIVGGDFLIDTLKLDHVFYTTDMGKNWKTPPNPTGGYRECIEFISADTAIAVGPGGSDITYDSGKSWNAMDEKYFHVIRKARTGNRIIAAGSKRISLVTLK